MLTVLERLFKLRHSLLCCIAKDVVIPCILDSTTTHHTSHVWTRGFHTGVTIDYWPLHGLIKLNQCVWVFLYLSQAVQGARGGWQAL
jgi:hypothetical protein